ncbi:TetR/AcrR family transcriptional regulator [Lentibacillus salicampi]|uniref:TetR/AcrR family transcriptional regulator n=1 Tax=Lentibacillus salicampi TaxID=175306 RepID=A0A4Y9A8D8_9BACI|nr:TetR/AcrR family transcriptional regulator [Lentibacillus salicampi]TFJ91502.1 TetR/AcrR family transcriptional regulator [Lentibacillus salicampi]
MSRPIGVNSEDTQQFIVDVATKIFEHKGYSATSMSDIKNETNTSKGTIYYHFNNKEELYLYCIQQVSNEFIRNWDIQSKNEQSAEKKLYIWANLNNIMLQKPIMNSLQEYFVLTNKNNYDAVLKLYEPEFQIVTRILEEGISRGEFKEDLHVDDVSVLLYNFITSLANAELFGYHSNQEQNNLYKLAVDLILPGLKK